MWMKRGEERREWVSWYVQESSLKERERDKWRRMEGRKDGRVGGWGGCEERKSE